MITNSVLHTVHMMFIGSTPPVYRRILVHREAQAVTTPGQVPAYCSRYYIGCTPHSGGENGEIIRNPCYSGPLGPLELFPKAFRFLQLPLLFSPWHDLRSSWSKMVLVLVLVMNP